MMGLIANMKSNWTKGKCSRNIRHNNRSTNVIEFDGNSCIPQLTLQTMDIMLPLVLCNNNWMCIVASDVFCAWEHKVIKLYLGRNCGVYYTWCSAKISMNIAWNIKLTMRTESGQESRIMLHHHYYYHHHPASPLLSSSTAPPQPTSPSPSRKKEVLSPFWSLLNKYTKYKT